MESAKAVEFLFSSLREVCPRVLVELRDTGGADVTVATEWASRHGLNCPSVINYASLLRGRWARRRAPRHAGEAIVSLNATTISNPKPVTVRERLFASEKVA